uniref:Uncharacterized protein n=1 Tax=Lygus hesperus TaxID=30085 RepID=A0A146LHU6_LYGHE
MKNHEPIADNAATHNVGLMDAEGDTKGTATNKNFSIVNGSKVGVSPLHEPVQHSLFENTVVIKNSSLTCNTTSINNNNINNTKNSASNTNIPVFSRRNSVTHRSGSRRADTSKKSKCGGCCSIM